MEPDDRIDPDTNEPENDIETEEKECRPKKKLPWKMIAIMAAVAAVILFAFLWEIFYDGDVYIGGNRGSGRPHGDNAPPADRSDVQNSLDALDWVEREFLPVNEFSRPGILLGEINGVVIHYVGNPGTTAMQNRNYFANLAITGQTYASSNFIICLDGLVIQCVPVDEIAYASNTRNADTLSIELCHPDETGEFTPETYESAVRLTAWLCGQYGLSSDDVIRHYDVTEKICPKFFVENEEAWEAFKNDVAEAMNEEIDSAGDFWRK